MVMVNTIERVWGGGGGGGGGGGIVAYASIGEDSLTVWFCRTIEDSPRVRKKEGLDWKRKGLNYRQKVSMIESRGREGHQTKKLG